MTDVSKPPVPEGQALMEPLARSLAQQALSDLGISDIESDDSGIEAVKLGSDRVECEDARARSRAAGR